MSSKDLRKDFLHYFKSKQHQIIPSSAVIPHNDPSLLFINAGMNQFKDVFLGEDIRDYTKATSSQKCVRAGGKHNDLENVGHTTRHLTFFEMLGNFSFGDYFKKEAIAFAWEVSTKIFKLDADKIWVSVFETDDESYELWKEHIPVNKIVRMGEADNFWAMGDVGPCGPCSELLYDRGPKFGKGQSPLQDPSGERFLEFWNLVFMQYSRAQDGTMTPLPKKSVDTGAGLERLIQLQMGVDSIFKTDILRSLIETVESISGKKYEEKDHKLAPAFQVIADHIRTLAFAIADGAIPSNIERGYVLRKILRRAVRYGKTLGLEKPFLAKLLPTLSKLMGDDYPELISSEQRTAEILEKEEEAFFRTLKRGGQLLAQVMQRSTKKISGEDAFKLKDTYGFPLEEILLIAKDENIDVDETKFYELEKEAKERSKKAHKTEEQDFHNNIFSDYAKKHAASKFVGYDELQTDAKVVAILCNENLVDEIEEGQKAVILLDKTPFYAEMGGQVADHGKLSHKNDLFTVENCTAPYKGIIAHIGHVKKGKLKVGQIVTANVTDQRRQGIANNHTATHLLHWALNKELGDHIRQAGSLVEQKRLRFDFNHHKALSKEDIRTLEDMINEKIRENNAVETYELSFQEVQKKKDIKQIFGEKYGDKVRVVDIDFSKELCGGTHTSRTGNIGLFKITKESSVAAGVRRIEAVTGKQAEEFIRQEEDLISSLADLLKCPQGKLKEKMIQQTETIKDLNLVISELKSGQMQELIANIQKKAKKVGSVHFIREVVEIDPKDFHLFADELVQNMNCSLIALAIKMGKKCQIALRITPDLVKTGLDANRLIQSISPLIQGGGGGKKHSAQAGGKNASGLEDAFEKIQKSLEES